MYDIVIIGDDVSSLVAALNCVHERKKTLLVMDGSVPDFFIKSSYRFDIDPFPWPGLNSKNILGSFLSQLNIPLSVHALKTPLQVIFPEHRVNMASDIEELSFEMAREFNINTKLSKHFWGSISGQVIPKFDSCPISHLARIPSSLFQYCRCFLAAVSFQKSPALKTLFDAQRFVFSYFQQSKNLRTSLRSYALTVPFHGNDYIKGGKAKLIQAMKKRFTSEGGTIENHNVSDIKIYNGIIMVFFDSEKNSKAETVSGKKLIISTKKEHLFNYLSRLCLHKHQATKELFAAPSAVQYPVTIHLGILDKGIPEEMGERVILIADAKKPFINGNLLYIDMSVLGDIESAPPKKRTLSVTAFIENPPEQINKDNFKHIMDSIFENLKKLLPFLEDHLDFFDTKDSIEIAKAYKSIISPRFTFSKKDRHIFSQIKTSFLKNNIYMTGGLLYPDYGFEGEILSGINAAKRAIGG